MEQAMRPADSRHLSSHTDFDGGNNIPKPDHRAVSFPYRRLIGIGAVVTHRPLPHHRAYGSVHGGSRKLL
jgi:hypothetical protein